MPQPNQPAAGPSQLPPQSAPLQPGQYPVQRDTVPGQHPVNAANPAAQLIQPSAAPAPPAAPQPPNEPEWKNGQLTLHGMRMVHARGQTISFHGQQIPPGHALPAANQEDLDAINQKQTAAQAGVAASIGGQQGAEAQTQVLQEMTKTMQAMQNELSQIRKQVSSK